MARKCKPCFRETWELEPGPRKRRRPVAGAGGSATHSCQWGLWQKWSALDHEELRRWREDTLLSPPPPSLSEEPGGGRSGVVPWRNHHRFPAESQCSKQRSPNPAPIAHHVRWPWAGHQPLPESKTQAVQQDLVISTVVHVGSRPDANLHLLWAQGCQLTSVGR